MLTGFAGLDIARILFWNCLLALASSKAFNCSKVSGAFRFTPPSAVWDLLRSLCSAFTQAAVDVGSAKVPRDLAFALPAANLGSCIAYLAQEGIVKVLELDAIVIAEHGGTTCWACKTGGDRLLFAFLLLRALLKGRFFYRSLRVVCRLCHKPLGFLTELCIPACSAIDG